MSDLHLILGSTSTYRRQLLEKLGVAFSQADPEVDETPLAGEKPADLAKRLGIAKAASVGGLQDQTDPWIAIGSDQVCHVDGRIYGKPGELARARQQLRDFSDRWVTFSTSLALLSSDGREFCGIEDYECHFRDLAGPQIEYYLALDEPFDCAGSIKVEAAGVTLLRETRGRDINSLYGLPLMLLCDGLKHLGADISDFNKVL